MARKVTIYDALGRPIRRQELSREQAAPDFAGPRSYFQMLPARAMTPRELANRLSAAAAGDLFAQARLFDDMEEKDAHIFAEMAKRRRAVSGLRYSIQPADDSARAVEVASFVEEVLESIGEGSSTADLTIVAGLPGLFLALSDAIGKGLSFCEIIWDLSAGQAVPAAIKPRPLDWFKFHPENLHELRLRDGTLEGEELIPGKWIVHFHPARSGSPYRAALYRVIAWLFLFRNYSVKAWAQFVEMFGVPMRIGKFPLGTPEEDQEKLLEALATLATEAAIVLPEGMEVEIKELLGRPGTPQREFLRWTEAEISKAILGATLTSRGGDEGSGSYALGMVHNDVRLDLLTSDTDQIAATINRQLIRPLVELNFGPEAPMPYLEFVLPKPDERKLYADVLEKLVSLGFDDVPLWWVREVFGIPAPEEGDETLRDYLRGGGTAREKNASLRRKKRDLTNDLAEQHHNYTPEDKKSSDGDLANRFERERRQNTELNTIKAQEGLDALIERLGETDTRGMIEALLAPVFELVSRANSYEEIMEGLAELYPRLKTEEFEKLLEQAIFIADIWGRLNA